MLGSTLVRNTVAAVLASAAAALLYKKSNKADRDDAGRGAGTENDGYDVPPAKQSVVEKAQRKAAAAADSVSKSAKSAIKKAARKAVVKTAKAAVEKGAKAAVKKARRLGEVAAASDEAAEPTKLPRKARSDAGTRRGSRKAVAQPEPALMFNPTSAADTETSPLALSSGAAASPDVAPVPTDEQVAEAHPS